MKFTDGNWMMQPGVVAFYPRQISETQILDGAIDLLATREVNHRGDTLDGPTLDVRLSSPQEGIIRVQVAHFRAGHPALPAFALTDTEPKVEISECEDCASLTSGPLTAQVSKHDWSIYFSAGAKVLTSSGGRSLALMQVEGQGNYLKEELSLGVGTNVYGLGERFTAFVKNGQSVDIWNRDGGTGSDQAYKNVPFYLTNAGYGVFVNHPENVSFEIASEKVSRVGFSVRGEALDYFVIYGPTPREILARYTALTGRPALPPAWSFGLWLTTSFTTSYDEDTVTSFIDGMETRDLPLSVIHFDCFWMREFRWCDFEWDQRVFPDPAGMLARLHARDLKVCVWINPYIAQRSPLFEEASRGGYLLKKPDGAVWQTDQWQAGMGIVDFTNPAARQWYGDYLGRLVDMGVDSFKTDFGERIPTVDVAWFDGSQPEKMHNYYAQIYNQTVFEVLEAKLGAGNAAVFARSATAGGQKFPVHWGGDCSSSFESMAESLRGGLSLGLSGFGFWSHDIGGFEGTPPAAVYKRWLAFGLLSSHSRLHGSTSYRVPWLFDEEAVDVLRHFTKLKCSLMPYIFAKAVEARESGLPLMRAMLLEHPDDPACAGLDRQYLLGESLLVAPVFSEEKVVEYYVPAGRWTHFASGAIVEGPGWKRETHDYFSLPLLVRPHSVLAVGETDARPDYDYTDGVTLRVYELENESLVQVTVPDIDGAPALNASIRREDNTVTVEVDAAEKTWRVLMVNREVMAANGARFTSAPLGTLLTPPKGASRVEIILG